MTKQKRGWDKSPSLSIVFGLSSKTQWLSGLYYADFISFYSPTQLCGGGTTKSNSNELPISVPLSFLREISTKCFESVNFFPKHAIIIGDYAQEKDLHVIVRGLRAITDFEYELQMAQTNRMLSHGKIDTVFLTTSLEYAYLSSSAIKQIASFDGDITPCVPDFVADLIYEKYRQKKLSDNRNV